MKQREASPTEPLALTGAPTSASELGQLLASARATTDYGTFQSLCRARRKLAARGPVPPQPVRARVALLGGATTTMLEEPLRLALESLGVSIDLHAAPYNTLAREMLDPQSETVAFRPDVAIVAVTPFNIPSWPRWNASAEEVDAAVGEVCEYWVNLCRSLHDNARCEIIFSNFHPLPARPLGTAGTRMPGDVNRFLHAVNDALARRLPPYVHIHDVESLSALHGVYRWFDERYWYHAKQPVSFECLVPYVRNVAQIIATMFGRAAKCVVVDLDNTLWGGVVGDDGAERLVLGEGDPRGEAFVAFQRYLLRLRERGVLLAVCSKNDERMALAPFTSRPEMLLRREHFVAFHANWRPKSENLREIAAALNIGLDALVFVDDNPAEREQVRQALPEVRVVEVDADPAGYVAALDRSGWLDALALSAEDQSRSAMYEANAARETMKASVTDYAAFLRSLEQRAVIAPFDAEQLDRITQLTNKTNQFNLTTRRLTRSELEAMGTSPSCVTAYVRLADRFGDNGLISVLAAHVEDRELWIDLWLMSCRVFNRGVEQLLCNHVVERARALGCTRIQGVYLPTAKNGIVKGHYEAMGFVPSGPHEGGERWTLEIERYRGFEPAIEVVSDYRTSGETDAKGDTHGEAR